VGELLGIVERQHLPLDDGLLPAELKQVSLKLLEENAKHRRVITDLHNGARG
jgi:hypothetical protein